jgi:two-component system OmpR family response regulator
MATVLVAEDDPVVLDLLTTVLEEELGVRVVGARDGRAALAALETIAADLVLVDMMMPGVDGAELATRIRQRSAWRSIPVIATSAAPIADRNMAPWSTDFIAKPFELEHLIEVVRSYLPASRAAGLGK